MVDEKLLKKLLAKLRELQAQTYELAAESVVQILIELGSPGCEFLDLVPVEAT